MNVITEIDERISVRADFTPGGKITPRVFRRGDREPFRVARIHSTWEDRRKRGRLICFTLSVEGSDDIYQLRYCDEDRTWRIDCVMPCGAK